ncbi:hypothetical protein EVG20_g7634 [Dentipellis fragilis]|uniref:Uncharacterized protein n=1 Tax=Dentipellis fragilis TaxID=205917 RepID=A0A4Y9YDQ3_9AGAM|nr:hypothetical protein EVG20_g7634 [Dentipellis fragilis]
MSEDPTQSVPLPLDTGPSASTVPQKRKGGGDVEGETAVVEPPATLPSEPGASSSEYESGRVICETCGDAVSFRDEETGGFTLRHWDAHKLEWHVSNTTQAPPPEPVSYPTDSVVDTLGNPPSKRRRAKRSEEERIEYLRSDPYVAQFEAYRVLCASCDKWIRLRPNSTYCSIPWDAHRKSCLAKKGSKTPHTNEHCAAAFSNDPDVKKFDHERVHCRNCNKWVTVGSDDQAVKVWAKHRSLCQPGTGSATSSAAPNVPPPSQHQFALASLPANARAPVPPTPSTPRPDSLKEKDTGARPVQTPIESPSTPSPSPLKEFALANPASAPAPPPESRRRNAEQRAALLRADSLLSDVEPNRVYCSLCQKWVQLRQDSSYCAYPWLQHRSKCILRNQKRVQKAEEGGAAASTTTGSVEMSVSPDESDAEGSMSGLDDAERERRREAKRLRALGNAEENGAVLGDGNGDMMMTDGGRRVNGKGKQAPSPAADLDSPAGRLKFVLHSISYLFQTTYGPSDALTIAALVAYLNTAMPPDKHEDFDTTEVTRAAKTLHDRGKLAFEGDTLKFLD